LLGILQPAVCQVQARPRQPGFQSGCRECLCFPVMLVGTFQVLAAQGNMTHLQAGTPFPSIVGSSSQSQCFPGGVIIWLGGGGGFPCQHTAQPVPGLRDCASNPDGFPQGSFRLVVLVLCQAGAPQWEQGSRFHAGNWFQHGFRFGHFLLCHKAQSQPQRRRRVGRLD